MCECVCARAIILTTNYKQHFSSTTCMYVCVYIYIYIYREREREGDIFMLPSRMLIKITLATEMLY